MALKEKVIVPKLMVFKFPIPQLKLPAPGAGNLPGKEGSILL
jgi:hypothetical protein